jgi:phosphate transport system protein
MSNPNPIPFSESSQIIDRALRGCEVARNSARAVVDGIQSNSPEAWKKIRKYEEELDTLDRQINEEVTSAIAGVSEPSARELLAGLKSIIELERIGDLFVNVANRLESVGTRMQPQDSHDISRMASIVSGMLGDVSEAFSARDVRRAIDVLKADVELDRLRNLVFIRHIENPENELRQESFHLVFISQALERAGDHAKNLAEEICHLVSGRSVRHILREYDRPVEQIYFERMRRDKQTKRED